MDLPHFHCSLQSLPPCLFYIEHILLHQRHAPTTPMHTLTTRGRLCAVEEPLVWFYLLTVSISCTHTDKDFVQGCCCCCCPNHPLSPQPIRGASQVHIFLNIWRIHWYPWYKLYSCYSVIIEKNKWWVQISRLSGWLFEMRCAEMDECLVHQCACRLPGWFCVVSVPWSWSVICPD